MKARYTGRRKRARFQLWSTRDIINGGILLVCPTLLMIAGAISESDLFAKFAFSLAISAPVPIAKLWYGEKK